MLIDRQRVRDATTRRDIDAPILGMHSGDHYRPFQRCMPKDLADVIDRLEFRQIAPEWAATVCKPTARLSCRPNPVFLAQFKRRPSLPPRL
jgi:hypothetical protein